MIYKREKGKIKKKKQLSQMQRIGETKKKFIGQSKTK